MVCDGAKSSCASKIAEAVDCGILAFNLARDGKVFKAGDGLVKDDIEATIDSIGRMAKDGMKSTDVEILNLLTYSGFIVKKIWSLQYFYVL